MDILRDTVANWDKRDHRMAPRAARLEWNNESNQRLWSQCCPIQHTQATGEDLCLSLTLTCTAPGQSYLAMVW